MLSSNPNSPQFGSDLNSGFTSAWLRPIFITTSQHSPLAEVRYFTLFILEGSPHCLPESKAFPFPCFLNLLAVNAKFNSELLLSQTVWTAPSPGSFLFFCAVISPTVYTFQVGTESSLMASSVLGLCYRQRSKPETVFCFTKP